MTTEALETAKNVAEAGTVVLNPAQAAFLEISQSTIYLMGMSFVVGSLFTILILLILDWTRSRKGKPTS